MSLRRHVNWWVFLLALLGGIVLVALVRCTQFYLAGEIGLFGDRAATLVYINETEQPLRFHVQYSGERLLMDRLVPPKSQLEAAAMITGPTLRIVAERPDGRKVFDRTYRWEEFTGDGRIVVSSLDPID